MFRPGLATSPGASLGVDLPLGAPFAVGLGVGLHPARSVDVAPEATLAETVLLLDGVVDPTSWLRLRTGVALCVRDYAQHGEPVARAALPQSSSAAEIAWRGGPWGFAVGTAVDVDLGRVLFDVGDASSPLFPISLRPLIRIDFLRTPTRGADIGESDAL